MSGRTVTTLLVPSSRLHPIINAWASAGGRREHLTRGHHALRKVCRDEYVTEQTADNLLSALERTDAWHVELADLHEQILEASSDADAKAAA